jgi:hypothetical protein
MGSAKSIDDGSRCDEATLIFGRTLYDNMGLADRIATEELINDFNLVTGKSITIDNIYMENVWKEVHPVVDMSILLSTLGLTGLILFAFIIKNAWLYGIKHERFKSSYLLILFYFTIFVAVGIQLFTAVYFSCFYMWYKSGIKPFDLDVVWDEIINSSFIRIYLYFSCIASNWDNKASCAIFKL